MTSERITEAELRTIERLEDGNRAALLFALRLVAEVRRLRGLIVGVAGVFVGGPGQCIACYHTLPDHRSDCDAAPVVAEASAIRDEGVIGPIPVMLGSPEPQVQWVGIPKDAAGVKRVWINGKPFVPESP